ncbi:hypothetical protein DICPUDRAFT_88517 [Dictyostelium purpureum]|uniref:EGF-like domain-containing protein n=1 Tax=Dictyostelium purpureum TaxID=5786 RepID=F0ZPX3_DICPU|nr:uncharacterized protein DICPUDRAFT_88517 [Dictyostelium purpureum]EGC34019.1 hypothetical protein DICPUDRAFT_88517 [Dictyostelium purpureum]|eukprot:XP_003289463.1 hypothetical protein DICPUDRAFT_88517 [Dictyostelium purpureum]
MFIIYGKKFTNDYFYSKFGEAANLNIVSNDCYELPPAISTLSFISGNSNLQLNTETVIGWQFTIESKVKIASAYFHVISDFDKQGYKYEFKPNSISFSDSLNFTVDPTTTRTQTFKIYNVTLIDERGIRSDYIDNYDVHYINTKSTIPKYPPPISPFYKLSTFKNLCEFKINSPFLPETTLPTLGQISPLTQGSINNDLTITLTVNFVTQDDTGLSKKHIPQLYLEIFPNFGNIIIIQCETTNSIYLNENRVSSNTAECKAPMSIGLINFLTISVYGIVDTSLNVAGYTASEINTNSGVYSLPVIIKPIISSHTSLTVNNDKLTLFGKNFPMSNGNAILVYSNTNTEIPLSFNYVSNVMVIINIPKSDQQFIIFTNSSEGQESNKYQVTYLEKEDSSSSSSSSEPPIVKCLNNCGGPTRGVCIENIGCRCIAPYSGISCLSETIKIPKPQINETSPDSRNEIPVSGTDIKLNTIISVVAIKELDISGNQINIHYLNEWNFTTISDSNYTYVSNIAKNQQNVSTIKVNMEWHEQSSTITFANQNFTINPFSLKYYIILDEYPFTSKLHSLHLIIKSEFKSSQTKDICSSKEISLNDGSDYMTLNIGKYSFEGKFIKKGVINSEDRIVSISNTLVDNFDTNSININETEKDSSNQQTSYIAIHIPYYNTKAILDPSFSVLIDPNGSSKNSANSICSGSSKKLTAAQIVGIVVGGAVFLVIIVLIIMLKFSKSSRFLSLKIFIYKRFRSK